MIRWIPTSPAPSSRRWQSRDEILETHLKGLSPGELRHVRADYYWLWFGQNAWLRHQGNKANFNPNQSRVPAGNPDGGQWTDSSGREPGNDSTDFSAVRRRGPRDLLPLPHFSPPRKPSMPRVPVQIVNNAQTGISTVDEATEKLKTVLENVVNSRPQGVGPNYGSEIHYAFRDAARDANIRGIAREDVETTFPKDAPYASRGSVRTDVVLRNEIGDVIAIYDVKTGSARLDARRVQELRTKTGAGPSIPVIEMHVQRGLSLKARVNQARHVWVITLRLWNPWIRGNQGR